MIRSDLDRLSVDALVAEEPFTLGFEDWAAVESFRFEDCVPSPDNFDRCHTEDRRNAGLDFALPLPGLALLAWRVHAPEFWPDLLSENDLVVRALQTHCVFNGFEIVPFDRFQDWNRFNLLKNELQQHPEPYKLDFRFDEQDTKTYHYCRKGVYCGLFQRQHKALDKLVELSTPLIDSALQRLPADLVAIITAYFRPLHLRCAITCPYFPQEWQFRPGEYPSFLTEFTTPRSYMDFAGAHVDLDYPFKLAQRYREKQERLQRAVRRIANE